jgi:DNA-binding response OmpR family regulator
MALILLIDDHAALRHTVRRMLIAEGHEVLEAEDGREGLALLDRHRPELVITDIVMPDKDGIETILDIKSRRTEAKIIAMSGTDLSRAALYLDAASKLGADEVVLKPFRADELMGIVDRLLGQKACP